MAKLDKRARIPKEVVTRPKYSTQEIYAIYDKALDILNVGVKSGVSNAPQGMTAMMLMADLLHGGAYAVPINQRPYYLTDRSQSPYYAGDIVNSRGSETAGLGNFLQKLWGGDNIAGSLVEEVLVDANVPHVLPKISSDESFATYLVTYAQLSTTDLFKQGTGGMKTLVEAATTGTKAFRGEGKEEEEGYSESDILKLATAMARADTAALALGGT